MTTGVREWLPHGVVLDEVVVETLEQAIAQWNARWFTGAVPAITDPRPVSGASYHEDDEAGWRLYRQAVAVRARRSALSRLVDKALDTSTETVILNEADRFVLEGLERKILDSLAEEIEAVFGLRAEPRQAMQKVRDPLADGGGLLFTLSEPSGRDLLNAAVPVSLVLDRVKASLGPRNRRRGALQPLAAALGSVNIAVEALVGKVELTLTELADLTVGDVLVLDRTLDQPVDIAGSRGHQVFAKARLTQVENGFSLVFDA